MKRLVITKRADLKECIFEVARFVAKPSPQPSPKGRGIKITFSRYRGPVFTDECGTRIFCAAIFKTSCTCWSQ